MAALQHAARRLCERALQRSHRVSPGCLPMSTSSFSKGKPDPATEMREARERYEKSVQEGEDFFRKLQGNQRRPTVAETVPRFPKPQPKTARARAMFALPFILGSLYYKNTEAKTLPEGEQNDDMN